MTPWAILVTYLVTWTWIENMTIVFIRNFMPDYTINLDALCPFYRAMKAYLFVTKMAKKSLTTMTCCPQVVLVVYVQHLVLQCRYVYKYQVLNMHSKCVPKTLKVLFWIKDTTIYSSEIIEVHMLDEIMTIPLVHQIVIRCNTVILKLHCFFIFI